MTRTALYRHFDATGALLYVGISLHPVSRQIQHSHGSDWYHEITDIRFEWFDTREDARAAELVAIEDEKPKHNKQSNPLWINPAVVRSAKRRAEENDFICVTLKHDRPHINEQTEAEVCLEYLSYTDEERAAENMISDDAVIRWALARGIDCSVLTGDNSVNPKRS